jgi:ComF family protein
MSGSSPANVFNGPKSWFRQISESLLHIAFPHVCAGCGSDLLSKENMLCIRCLAALPETFFHQFQNNPVEKLFYGRLPLQLATAQYYFTKESLMQSLVFQFKYKGAKELGFYLGQLMGHQLATQKGFQNVDALVPLPLYPQKERKRGFNQATVLCEGIADILQKPVLKNAVARKTATESQTRKSRVERWQNMEGRFELTNEVQLKGKHILLVDDVVTTGATLEACGRTLLQAENVQLSIATLCFSST